MSRQSWLLAALCLIFLLAGFGAAVFWRAHRAGGEQSIALLTGTLIEPQRALGDFALLDEHGRSFGPAQLRGMWSVLYFGYTNCPDVCPTTLSTLAGVARQMQQRSWSMPQVVFVSVDSRRDTPAKLAGYVRYFDAQFRGVTGAGQEAVDAFAHQLGVAVIITPARDGTYTVDHTGALFVIAPSGRLAAVLSGPLGVAALRDDLHKLTTGAG